MVPDGLPARVESSLGLRMLGFSILGRDIDGDGSVWVRAVAVDGRPGAAFTGVVMFEKER